MPQKPDPQFAKELKEANEPKQKEDPHKKSREMQQRLKDIQRASDAAKRRESERQSLKKYKGKKRSPLDLHEDSSYGRDLDAAQRKSRIEQEAREKTRAGRKKKQGTIGPARKSRAYGSVKKTQLKRQARAAARLKKKTSDSKKRDPQSRYFRGRG